MAKTKKPAHPPSLPFPPAPDALHQEGHWLWIPLRKEWRDVSVKPEVIRPSLQQLKAMADKNPRAFDEAAFQLTVLERMQLVNRIQKVCEREFGEAVAA